METEEHRAHISDRPGTTTKLLQIASKESRPFQAFLTKFANDWSMTFAGVLAYGLLMAILPITIAVVAILGFILGSANRNTVVQQASHIFPGLASQQNAVSLAIDQLSKQAGLLAVIAIALAIFGGSRLFITIEGCLDIIYRVRPRLLVRQNLVAFGMFILFIILIPIMVFASAAPGFILNTLGQNPVLSELPFVKSVVSNPFVAYLASIVGGLIASFILFEAIYFVVPNQPISWRNSWRGALAAAVAMELFLNLFPLYTHYFLKNYAGQIGFAVILLLFFYYFAVILMIGAEVNAFFFEGIRPMPDNLAAVISTTIGRPDQDRTNGAVQAQQPQTTERADKTHNTEAQDQKAQDQQKGQKKRFAFLNRGAKKQQRDHTRAQEGQSHSKKWTVASVALGSVMTVAIELLQQRHRGK